VIAQAEVRERDGRQSANVIDAALMAVSQHWIPTESSHERVITEKLVDEGRAYIKPLLYNQAGDVVFPDFVLTDRAGGEVPMEVFGRSDEDYVKRKDEKTAYYNRLYGVGGWWCWDATKASSIPPFAPLARTQAGAK
jgi:predicted nuclease of restriction endonuclease-like RecB superfamily